MPLVKPTGLLDLDGMAADEEKRSETASADGRVRRGARNHEAIVQAIYALIQETHLPPTVDDVAARAGVGRRTVFRQFEDLDALYRSMGERVLREALGRVVLAAPSGILAADLAALVERRGRIYEFVTPFRRASRLVRHESAFVREQQTMMSMGFRAALLAVLEPANADEDTFEALDLLLSFEAWERLRHQQSLSVERAQELLTRAALTLVTANERR